MEERWFIKVGNCYTALMGVSREPVMKADYKKAEPFLTQKEAKLVADRKGIKGYKIVKKMF